MPCTLADPHLPSVGCDFVELNKTLNFSVQEAIKILAEYRNSRGHILDDATQTLLIVIYSLLIGFGVSANLLLCFVVARKSQMHTPRNLYIVNLSISDMSMCAVCMPFTLIMILRREWQLGTLLCKLVPVLQGTNIMISIGTITMIALDRYFTIVRGHNSVTTRGNVFVCIICVWLFSILASSPLAYYQVVQSLVFSKIILYDKCMEVWPSPTMKIAYAVCNLLIQAVIPATVVGVVHIRIASYLHHHAKSQRNERRAERELKRNKKTTALLLGIAVLFLASWLPLSLFSLMADILYPPGTLPDVSTEKFYLILAACHIVAMTSAVSNPIVYGFLNANIRYEFKQLFSWSCARLRGNHTANGDEQTTTRTCLAVSAQRNVQLKSEKAERSAGTSPLAFIL